MYQNLIQTPTTLRPTVAKAKVGPP